MSDFLGIHGTALALREQRLQVLASNLANADTPGFQARDLDFNTALQAALSPATGEGVDALQAAALYHHRIKGDRTLYRMLGPQSGR